MALNIPIFNNTSSDFSMQIELENNIYDIRLVFNVRSDSWHMTIGQGNFSVTGLKLVSNFPLLTNHKSLFSILEGDFIVDKINDSAGDEITYSNLGVDYILSYITPNEYNQWRSNNGFQ